MSTRDRLSLKTLARILTNYAQNPLWALVYQPRATSHMRLRARDTYTSSTLIGGKGGAGPSSSFTVWLRDQRSEYVYEHIVKTMSWKWGTFWVGITPI